MKVKKEDVEKKGGRGILWRYNGSLKRLLLSLNPHWNSFFASSSSSEEVVQSTLQNLLLDTFYVVNYKHPLLVHSETMKKMELDVFIPSLQLAIEYQGEQHFHHRVSSFGHQKRQRIRDFEKKEECRRLGITLIQIPFWWNSSSSSSSSSRNLLLSTISRLRPDLHWNERKEEMSS
jgi:hypothetical protein